MQRLGRNILSAAPLALGQAVAQGANVLGMVILARHVPVGSLGSYAAAFGAASTLSILLEFGSSDRIVSGLSARVPRMESHFRETYSYFARLTAILGVISLGIYSLVMSSVWTMVPFLASASMFLRISLVPFRSKVQNVRVATAIGGDKMLATLVLVGVVTFSKDVDLVSAYFLIQCVSSVALGALAWRTWAREYPRGNGRTASPYAHERGFGWTQVTLAWESLDVASVSLLAGKVVSGEYGAINRWLRPLLLPSLALGQTSLPILSSLPSHRLAVRRAMLLTGVALAFVTPVSILAAAFAGPVVDLALGPRYDASATALSVLALAAIPTTVNFLWLTLMQARGLASRAAMAFAFMVPAQLIVTATLAAWEGPAGAAAGALIGQCAILLALVTSSRPLFSSAAQA